MFVGVAASAPTGATSPSSTAFHRDLAAIPAFARRYRTGCSRCHVAAPKLNAVGEAFRLNGYRFPEGEPAGREEPPVALGEEPWKDLWPKAIWPGEIPATAPIAFRIQSDVEVLRDGDGKTATNFRFPQDVYLLAGGSLGPTVAAFVEGEWNRDDGAELLQAKVGLLRLVPGLGARTVNVWLGLQNLFLFTFADRQIDRATRQPFLWQRFGVADVSLPRAGGNLTPVSPFRLGSGQPSIEVNGLIGPRLYYGVGLGQGGATGRRDNNGHKDAYYKLRLKLGGLGLDGSYPATMSTAGSFGQFQDRTVIVEAFGYFGREPNPGDGQSRHRSFGANVRAIRGPLDLGVGAVRSVDDHPYGAGLGALRMRSLFAKGEYAMLPWLFGSLKAEWLTVSVPAAGSGSAEFRQHHLMPGVAALIRQNVRLVAEADLYPEYATPIPRSSPRGVWLRLDLAF